MTILTLVRHGTTEWMEQKKLHGIKDSPLSLRGKGEAALTARFLSSNRYDAFYTSPLGRAVETAEIIAETIGISPKSLDGLTERNFGIMEGKTNFASVKLPVFIKPIYLACVAGIITITGEPRSHFKKRLFQTGQAIAEKHPNQNILAVAHSSVISHLIALLIDKKPNTWRKYNNSSPCSITELEISSDGVGRLINFNMHDHISP
jgi:broad specificity phosphatase PhoE